MPKNMMQIKHTKKGMKKLIKNIALLQMNYVSVGIHKTDNKPTSGVEQKKAYNAIQKALKRAEKGSGKSSQKPESGLDKTSNRSGNSKSGKKGFNLATLAYYLEQPVSWVQGKTVRIQGVDGIVTIWEGARIHRPARVFIRIFKLSEIWNKVKNFIRMQVRNFYLKSGTNRTQFWNTLGTMVSSEQKGVIQTSHNAGNSDVTIKIKGKNHPLFDTGKLLNSSSYKVEKNYNQGEAKITRLKYLADIDRVMKQLG